VCGTREAGWYGGPSENGPLGNGALENGVAEEGGGRVVGPFCSKWGPYLWLLGDLPLGQFFSAKALRGGAFIGSARGLAARPVLLGLIRLDASAGLPPVRGGAQRRAFMRPLLAKAHIAVSHGASENHRGAIRANAI